MNTETNTLDITSIQFESNDPTVSVSGTVQQGVLQYDSEFLISHTQLNQLLNQLIGLNENFQIGDYLDSGLSYDQETIYSAELPSTLNKKVDLAYLSQIDTVRQIRA